ncbi:Mhp1p NDAI_0C02260 [Naumovozyma dairenensis CBS 421]|uniref:MAP-homologous protein 1 n=1 Tax=Naumovozyma dairenensis (strain ATCC 10597 / BCRC 20456 / CBS 421 / NBRC 0211 / NRRL Y-12639) TaxID=1071378 RepID=G0W7X5_NAUDC|nr:hypothetical protein NDAI_0C02260 [Naumovozyma dairenensis CBS 421]CCD23886.1 hypothetical protein NDAI_0C02260 [Naumovozyma dairenensis CBS 421]
MNIKDTQKLFQEHQRPSLDVDWFIRSKRADTPHVSHHENETSIEGTDPTSSTINVARANYQADSNRLRKRNSIATSTLLHPSESGNQQEHHHHHHHHHRNDDDDQSVTSYGQLGHTRRKSVSNDSNGNKASLHDKMNSTSLPLRRSKSVSMGDSHSQKIRNSLYQDHSSPPKKMGFFRSLFSKKPRQLPNSTATVPTTKLTRGISTNNDEPSNLLHDKEGKSNRKNPPMFKENYSLNESKDNLNEDRTFLYKSKTQPEPTASPNSSNISMENDYDDNSSGSDSYNEADNRLSEFIEYYKKNGYSVNTFKEKKEGTDYDMKSSHLPNASFTIDEATIQPTKKVDIRGRPLPPHPAIARLPSAFKKRTNFEEQGANVSEPVSLDKTYIPNNTGSSKKFGAFLKRVTSYGTSNPSVNNKPTMNQSLLSVQSTDSTCTTSFDPSNTVTVPGLEGIKPLKHVSFATNTYFNDPPQQICSKNPRKGEVEVKPNGSVIIHRLTPAERRKILESTSSGIVVGGSGQLKLISDLEEQEKSSTDKITEKLRAEGKKPNETMLNKTSKDQLEDEQAQEEQEEDIKKNSKKRSIVLAAAEAAAEARAKETPNELRRTVTNNEEEVTVSSTASHLTIDKPMISRRSNASLSSASLASQEVDDGEGEIFPSVNMKIPHDIVYTRCCHLREILPIPATLKQLKTGSTDPIPLLQLRNPRPSMVEIWSFSDFLSIAPVLCLSLDGVSLTVQMLRIILSSLITKDNFEKLSLRNTPLDDEGWKLLCYFISKSKSLISLDLTMVPHIKTNVQKPSKSSLKNNLSRMESNLENRTDRNWDLLTAAIAMKNGLEEIVIAGAKIPLFQFTNFIDVACVKTQRLGLAYNDLSKEQCENLAKWIIHSKVTGLDIGFNDLRGKLSTFTDAVWDKIQNKRKANVLKYLSLNDTCLEVEEGATSETNDVLRLLSVLCYSENLKFLDLSNNPKCFPNCVDTLIKCLPVFVNLVRLHLDYNDLTSTTIVMLAEALPLCSRLNHVSMLGNALDLASCKALTEAFRRSSSLLTLDIDYAYMPENIKEKITMYAMRNIQKELGTVDGSGKQTAMNGYPLKNLQEELSGLLTENTGDENHQAENVDRFIKRSDKIRTTIEKVVEDLFNLRVQGQLSLEGKETLIRLCFMDRTLEKGIRLLRSKHRRANTVGQIPEIKHVISTDSEQSTASDAVGNNDIVQSVFTSTTFGKSGHSALLPFGTAEVEKPGKSSDDDDADETIAFKESDNGTTKIISPEILQKDAKNEGLKENTYLTVDRATLDKAVDTLDSDEIKNLLLKNDATEVVTVIDELHNRGYHLHHIFKKHPEDKQKEASKDGDLKTTVLEINTGKTAGNSKEIIPTEAVPFNEFMNNKEEEAIDAAYDQVLDNLQEVRDKQKKK